MSSVFVARARARVTDLIYTWPSNRGKIRQRPAAGSAYRHDDRDVDEACRRATQADTLALITLTWAGARVKPSNNGPPRCFLQCHS